MNKGIGLEDIIAMWLYGFVLALGVGSMLLPFPRLMLQVLAVSVGVILSLNSRRRNR